LPVYEAALRRITNLQGWMELGFLNDLEILMTTNEFGWKKGLKNYD